MNKKIIMASAASAVLAAMPVVGALAEDVTTVTDTVSVTVNKSCSLGVEAAGATPTTSLTGAGAQDNIQGSAFKIVCTGGEGWTLTAVGATDGGGAVTDLYNTEGSASIPSTGEIAIDNTHKNWGFKLTGTHVAAGYDNFKAIPASDTEVASNTSDALVEDIKITYGVSNDGSAPAGSYTGKVKYTLTEKSGE